MHTTVCFRSPAYCLLLLAGLSLLLPGCGGREIAGEVAPVSGTVTYKGNPVADAAVVFYPVGGGKVATGKTDDQGKYTLTTYDSGDGALVGEHSVTVVVQPSVTETEIDSPDAYAVPEAGGGSSIPAKYASKESSGLTKTVASGDNDIPIELTD